MKNDVRMNRTLRIERDINNLNKIFSSNSCKTEHLMQNFHFL